MNQSLSLYVDFNSFFFLVPKETSIPITNTVNNPSTTATKKAVNKPSTTTTTIINKSGMAANKVTADKSSTNPVNKPSTTFSAPDYVSIIRSTSSATICPVVEAPPPPTVVQSTYHYAYPMYYPNYTSTETTIMPESYSPQPYLAKQQAPYAIINGQTPYPVITEPTPYLSTQQTPYPVIEPTFHILTEQPAVLPSMIEQPVPTPPMNEQPIQEQDTTQANAIVARDLKEGEEEKSTDDTSDREIVAVKNSKVDDEEDDCIIVGENSAEKKTVPPRQLNDKTSATTSTGTVTETNDSKKRVRLPRYWKVKMTNEGDIFYHNSLTGENCSSRPEI